MSNIDDSDPELERSSERESDMAHRENSPPTHDEIEQRVNERTSELSAINNKLMKEIAEHERAEIGLTLLKDELSADLRTMIRLHELTTCLIGTNELQKLLDRHQTLEALSASESRFRRYFELGLIGMAITSPTKGVLEVNDELCRILGHDRDELLQRPWAELTHPDDIAADVKQFNRVLAGEIDGYTLNKRWIRKDGSVISSIVSAKCVRHADRSVDYFVGLVQDTTERQRAEAQVRKVHQQIDMLLESISDNFFSLDKEGRFSYFNKHAAQQLRALGRDPETLIGKVAWEEFPDMPNYQNVKRVLDERVVVVDEIFYEPLQEWFENHMYPSPDGGLVTFQRCITERKRTEEELRRTQAELAHVIRLTTVGELTASIAHEVNQPLGAIVTNGHACLHLLSRDKPDLYELGQALESIIADGIRAGEVIKRVRRLAKKSSGGKSTHSVNDIVREVLALLAVELARNAINVSTRLELRLPFVIADRVQIQQVMLNLILNSKEAMSVAGCQRRDLMIRTEQTGPEILVTVADTGGGITPEDQRRVFDPFFTTKEGGLGLGLSISKTIINAHGGRLWISPTENGHGTISQFTLPG
jgi:PAS domain S-box-containing protein